jgi:hypothetical protein
MSVTKCLWCGRAFTPRTSGGTPAKFCSAAAHREAYHSAVRHWAEAEIAGGRLTVPKSATAQRARSLQPPLPPRKARRPRTPPLMALPGRPGEAEELLADLVGVLFGLRGDAWAAVCAAVPASFRNGSIATSGRPEN